ncbi:MAG: carboxylesterase/lipase family protein [Oscillospiraceae bacterium]|nr:carboxylesterase/lipase family protein [Oscillospiraceae bacterium]
MPEREIVLQTACGALRGRENERCRMFFGVPFARAGRFEYAESVGSWDGELDARTHGPACPQNRAVHEHLEHPTRRFYKREFREGLDFRYGEDCLNLDIYAPKDAAGAPVILFFYGGGFDSGVNWESPFDGSALAERGIVTVFANYRVGPLGYLTHAELKAAYGREGNFGLDDQLCAIRWVKAHAGDFGGDGENLTLMGQSAGAISIQYLCLNEDNAGLFRRVVMLSGAGLFPKFSLPRPAEETRGYWEQFIREAGCGSLDQLRRAPLDTIFDAVEKMKALRKDGVYHTMPVVDGVLLKDGVDKLIRRPLAVGCLLGYTNNDLYAPLMAWIGNRYARRAGAYVYFFDLDAPGDDNRAFHSAELRYVFGTLEKSWRPYGARDYAASAELLDYLANYARCGDPNGAGLPRWSPAGPGLRTAVLRIGPQGTGMGRAPYARLLKNALTKGDPKA